MKYSTLLLPAEMSPNINNAENAPRNDGKRGIWKTHGQKNSCDCACIEVLLKVTTISISFSLVDVAQGERGTTLCISIFWTLPARAMTTKNLRSKNESSVCHMINIQRSSSIFYDWISKVLHNYVRSRRIYHEIKNK